MLRIVDKTKEHVVQKVTTSNSRVVRYQVFRHEDIGDADKAVVFYTLSDCRKYIGKGNLTPQKTSSKK